jgi:hypothetical protein
LKFLKAGTHDFGPNQTANDPDGAVDHDERLRITGVTTGAYDVRLTFEGRRTCFARNVEIREGKLFSIEDKELVDCTRPCRVRPQGPMRPGHLQSLALDGYSAVEA